MANEEIILRALEFKDAELIYQYENDVLAWRNGVNTRFYSSYAIEQYIISNQNEDITKCEQCRFMIDVRGDDSLKTVGCVDLYDIDFVNARVAVGIYIDISQRNNGYAKKTLFALEKYIKNILNLHQIYAFVSKANTISQKLFTFCGYINTAELKDWVKHSEEYINVLVFQKKIGIN